MGSRRSFGLVMVSGHMMMTTQRPDDAMRTSSHDLSPRPDDVSYFRCTIFTQRSDDLESSPSRVSALLF